MPRNLCQPDLSEAPQADGFGPVSRLSFQARALLTFVGLTLITLVGASVVMYLAAGRAGLESALRHLQVANRIVSTTLQSRDRELRYATVAVAADYGFREAVASRDKETILSALENQRIRIHADLFALVDERGSITISHAEKVAAVSALTLQAAFAKARSGEPEILPLPDGQLVQVVLTPVKAPLLIGYVYAGFVVDEGFLKEIKSTVGAEISLLSIAPEDNAYELAASTLSPHAKSALERINLQSLRETHEIREVHLADDAYLTQVADMSQADSSYLVVAQLPMSRVAAPVIALRKDMLLFGGIMTVLCLLAAVWGARMLAEPVRALAHAARALSTSRRSNRKGMADDELGQLARAFHALAQQAHYDGLTGLPNRALLKERLKDSLERMRQSRRSMAVVFIDLNGFKGINDSLGHEMGDLVLRKTAQRLSRSVAAPHTVARLGGDEFVLVLEETDRASAIRTVEGLASVVSKAMASPTGPVKVGMSAGIAMYPEVAQDGEQLLKMADAAMYQSKMKKGTAVFAERNVEANGVPVPEEKPPAADFTKTDPELTASAEWRGRDLATQATMALTGGAARLQWVAAGIPADEADRLKALRRLHVLDKPPRDQFDRITRILGRTLNAPYVLISLVDEHRQWFLSRVGIEATETPREISFCAHAVFDGKPLVVPDACLDERFSGNPSVTGDPWIRAYAGVPVYSVDGHALGTLCVCDKIVRKFSPAELTTLQDVAHLVEEMFRLRELSLDYRRRRKEKRSRGRADHAFPLIP